MCTATAACGYECECLVAVVVVCAGMCANALFSPGATGLYKASTLSSNS